MVKHVISDPVFQNTMLSFASVVVLFVVLFIIACIAKRRKTCVICGNSTRPVDRVSLKDGSIHRICWTCEKACGEAGIRNRYQPRSIA